MIDLATGWSRIFLRAKSGMLLCLFTLGETEGELGKKRRDRFLVLMVLFRSAQKKPFKV
jgi:hypothetical protein